MNYSVVAKIHNLSKFFPATHFVPGDIPYINKSNKRVIAKVVCLMYYANVHVYFELFYSCTICSCTLSSYFIFKVQKVTYRNCDLHYTLKICELCTLQLHND